MLFLIVSPYVQRNMTCLLPRAVDYFSTLTNKQYHQNNDTMNQERGLQAAIGIVMAFSILWTLAILVPDDSSSSAVSMQRFDGLVVNGNHYVLDTNVDQTSSVEGYKVIHAVKTPTKVQVKKSRNTKRVSNHIDSCVIIVSDEYSILTHHFALYRS